MDFKSLISKIESIDGKIETPKAPVLAKAVQLNEDAELRVLAGQTSYLAEAKKKAEEKKEKEVEEGFDADAKVGDTFKTAKGTATKTATGVKHSREKYDYDPGSDDKEDKKRKETARKAKKESVDPKEFTAKFAKMVEAKKSMKDPKKEKKMAEGAKPDANKDGIPDYAQDGKGANDLGKGKGGDKKDAKKGMSDKQAKYFGKKKNQGVAEGGPYDLGKEYGAPAPGKKPLPRGGSIPRRHPDEPDFMDPDQRRLRADQERVRKAQAEYHAKKGVAEGVVPKGKKRPVKESVETKLTFKQMVQLVQESGGQQQIDPMDKELFNWATRVAANKLGEGMKAELYAGLIYERNGGVFEMYDVLSEAQK